jgi:hypothetical protein
VIVGVIGAMVTLAVILGLAALVLLLGRFRLVRKNKLLQQQGAGSAAHGGATGDVEKLSYSS